MDEYPRKILKDLISRYGTSLATDPLRTEGLLRDTCGTYHREIFVLVNAVRQKVPADLLAPRHSLPFSLLQGFLAKRLCDELSMSDDASRWAVDSWADALGLVSGAPVPEPDARTLWQEMPKLSAIQPDPVSVARRQQWADDLESPSLETRLSVVQDISKTPDPENLRLLMGALENGNWQVREGAFDVLSAHGEGAIPALCEALNDTNDQVVWRASLILGAIRAHRATGQLIHLLDRKGIVRECAIWSLGEIGDAGASTALLKYLHTDDPAVRHEAETALIKIGRT